MAKHYDHFGELCWSCSSSEGFQKSELLLMILPEVEAGLYWACFLLVWLSFLLCLCVLAGLFSSKPVETAKNQFSDFLVIIINLITIRIADFTLFLPLSKEIVHVKTIFSCQGNFRNFSVLKNLGWWSMGWHFKIKCNKKYGFFFVFWTNKKIPKRKLILACVFPSILKFFSIS